MDLKDLLGFPRVYGNTAIGVSKVDRAVAWYSTAFNFGSEVTESGEVYVGYPSDDGVRRTILLVPIPEGRAEVAVGRHPILFT